MSVENVKKFRKNIEENEIKGVKIRPSKYAEQEEYENDEYSQIENELEIAKSEYIRLGGTDSDEDSDDNTDNSNGEEQQIDNGVINKIEQFKQKYNCE